ncbi:MAG: hypothetical protein US53_C0003G0009 [Candidatus Woesebacteria bacterium GW2011_GWA1_37_7]|uniref:Permease n=2 Tax=Candidatus Woeseibacteriota TaxID=1752722 RepID=A0A0G0H7B6_9BACT|nr:MAG: hypothetical protein US53_C0003G0009 [Candidatus Woesebacteria bacterium GW2011_GWA1_37_7]OGM19569.1 MAG: hypothetical protein A2685_00165 [Candidatus Woesebacteria bacterium RIFCSPHIGHO2_01_FULL_37_10]
MKQISRHLQHYLPLVGILLSGILGFYIFSYDRAFQSVLVVALGTAYVTWGLVHHYIHGDLNMSVLLEYLAIAILGCVMIFSVLFRS